MQKSDRSYRLPFSRNQQKFYLDAEKNSALSQVVDDALAVVVLLVEGLLEKNAATEWLADDLKWRHIKLFAISVIKIALFRR